MPQVINNPQPLPVLPQLPPPQAFRGANPLTHLHRVSSYVVL